MKMGTEMPGQWEVPAMSNLPLGFKTFRDQHTRSIRFKSRIPFLLTDPNASTNPALNDLTVEI